MCLSLKKNALGKFSSLCMTLCFYSFCLHKIFAFYCLPAGLEKFYWSCHHKGRLWNCFIVALLLLVGWDQSLHFAEVKASSLSFQMSQAACKQRGPLLNCWVFVSLGRSLCSTFQVKGLTGSLWGRGDPSSTFQAGGFSQEDSQHWPSRLQTILMSFKGLSRASCSRWGGGSRLLQQPILLVLSLF